MLKLLNNVIIYENGYRIYTVLGNKEYKSNF
jgi:hypothetical protein